MARKRCARKGGCSNLITFNNQRVNGYGNATGKCWLLEFGFWDDLCFWVDAENWVD